MQRHEFAEPDAFSFVRFAGEIAEGVSHHGGDAEANGAGGDFALEVEPIDAEGAGKLVFEFVEAGEVLPIGGSSFARVAIRWAIVDLDVRGAETGPEGGEAADRRRGAARRG